ncbi:MAG: hypothetical protein U2P89_01245 [Proteiniphilum sp.]|nr:hypothetical protein [Proteiniphilum sp.]MDY9917478.1 hypothetical protein [Proteiniphilum sp.]
MVSSGISYIRNIIIVRTGTSGLGQRHYRSSGYYIGIKQAY